MKRWFVKRKSHYISVFPDQSVLSIVLVETKQFQFACHCCLRPHACDVWYWHQQWQHITVYCCFSFWSLTSVSDFPSLCSRLLVDLRLKSRRGFKVTQHLPDGEGFLLFVFQHETRREVTLKRMAHLTYGQQKPKLESKTFESGLSSL